MDHASDVATAIRSGKGASSARLLDGLHLELGLLPASARSSWLERLDHVFPDEASRTRIAELRTVSSALTDASASLLENVQTLAFALDALAWIRDRIDPFDRDRFDAVTFVRDDTPLPPTRVEPSRRQKLGLF